MSLLDTLRHMLAATHSLLDDPEYVSEKAKQAKLEAQVKEASKALKSFPSGHMGLTPDHVKQSTQYQRAKRTYDEAHTRLRNFNKVFLKKFSKHLKMDRRR